MMCIQFGLAQDILFSYGFDDCSFEDMNNSFPGITPGGNPDCVCGLDVQAYDLDGISDNLNIPLLANEQLNEDFTLDFYFWMDDVTGEVDIMSHRNGCSSLDSIMTLRYFSSTDEMLFEIASNVNNYYSIRATLDKDYCWHRFTLVKFGLEYILYFDNVLIKKILVKETIVFSKLAQLSFANSPCSSTNSRKFSGRLDKITLYKRALSDLEIKDSYAFPDQIETQNITIFKGESITLQTGTTCANNILWSPDTYLDDDTSLSPTATPEESITYTIELDNGSCISTDTVRIFVADRDKLNCDELLVPNAFTPNNDGLNDRFGISNTFLVEDLTFFEVYDRWGAKVWQTNVLTDQWDGSINNQPAPGGMYLYKIKYTCNATEKFYVNNFTLLR